MSKLTHLRQVIALCFFFNALQTRGVRLHPAVLEFAVHQTSYGGPNDNYYGLHATMDVYGHKLKPGQWSTTAIWIYPERYGDSRPHFYTQWTRDGHGATGCFNMDCPGFVRANGAAISPGDAIQPVSDVPHGHIQSITLRVLKDKQSGDWWVYYGFNSVPTGVGYFPKSLFTYLANKANQLAFGGAVVAHRAASTPPMGSGSFPNGGRGRAASFTNLGIIDEEGNSKPIMADFPTLVTNKKCHSITPINHAACLYGGPGGCVR
ncbi:hypothetical protein ACQJBY_052662 [Aegilops geniculata]